MRTGGSKRSVAGNYRVLAASRTLPQPHTRQVVGLNAAANGPLRFDGESIFRTFDDLRSVRAPIEDGDLEYCGH